MRLLIAATALAVAAISADASAARLTAEVPTVGLPERTATPDRPHVLRIAEDDGFVDHEPMATQGRTGEAGLCLICNVVTAAIRGLYSLVDDSSVSEKRVKPAPAAAAAGEPPIRSTHGDWHVRCDTPAGARSEHCVLMQFVTAEDRENVGLTVIVVKTADGKARLMRVLAPLGVLLPSGLVMRIDGIESGRAGFVRCLPNGCIAEVIIEDQLLTWLEGGQTATFIIFQTPEEWIDFPISLAGFQPGFEALP